MKPTQHVQTPDFSVESYAVSTHLIEQNNARRYIRFQFLALLFRLNAYARPDFSNGVFCRYCCPLRWDNRSKAC